MSDEATKQRQFGSPIIDAGARRNRIAALTRGTLGFFTIALIGIEQGKALAVSVDDVIYATVTTPGSSYESDFGFAAGSQTIAGNSLNSAVGASSGNNVVGSDNSVFGASSGLSIIGSFNTGLGFSSLLSLSGVNNIGFGSA
jgi:hypothetical protein